MAWINFNESLNNLKGQLSNFASGVLTDTSGDGSGNFDLIVHVHTDCKYCNITSLVFIIK